jgi:hypothetical protein
MSISGIWISEINNYRPLWGDINFIASGPEPQVSRPRGDQMNAKPIVIEPVPEYSGLDGANADNYYRAGQRSALIDCEVIDPFQCSLKQCAGYGNGSVPDSEEEIPVNVGNYEFLLKATPATRRPGYKAVFQEMEQYLNTRMEEYKKGERPVGVLTIDNEPYIPSGDLLKRIRKARNRIISRDANVSISGMPEPPSVQSMILPLGMDMAELCHGNAGRYLEALSLDQLYKEVVSSFEEDMIGLTGLNNDSPPDQTEHLYRRLGSHIFHVKSIPYESTNWGKALAGLDKDPPKRKPENGGDLTLIEMGLEISRLEIYRVRKRQGRNLVRLDGLISRMESLEKGFTKTKVRQRPIIHYPIV